MILILTNKFDVSVDYVIRELELRGAAFVRLNSEDLPSRPCTVSLTPLHFTVPTDVGSVNLADSLSAVLFRRPGKPFEFADEDFGPEQQFCADQWAGIIQGLIAIPKVKWLNDPLANKRADSKIYQLAVAEKIGFKIPRTCITSDVEELLRFFRSCNDRIIAKALETPLIEYVEEDFFVFSQILKDIKAEDYESIRISPTIYQEVIDSKVDIRVTVIGDNVLAAEVLRTDGEMIVGDWRVKKELHFQHVVLPRRVAEMCASYVKEMGLTFGAIDLLRSGDDFFFLEVNSNGEWGWLQRRAELPIAQVIADELIRGA